MVYTLSAAARREALEVEQLIDHTRVIEQADPARVDQWQSGKIDIGFGLVGGFVLDSVLGKLFYRPLLGVAGK